MSYSQEAADLLTQLREAREQLAIDRAVCICPCPPEEHENYGDEGEACEDETHQCLRVAPAVRELFRAAEKRAEELREQRDTARWERQDALVRAEDAEADYERVQGTVQQYVDYLANANAHADRLEVELADAVRDRDEARAELHVSEITIRQARHSCESWERIATEKGEALAASQARAQRLREALEKIRNLYATDSLGARNYSKNGNWVAVEIAENALAEAPPPPCPSGCGNSVPGAAWNGTPGGCKDPWHGAAAIPEAPTKKQHSESCAKLLAFSRSGSLALAGATKCDCGAEPL